MDILYLLDRLEEELTAGKSVPFTDRKLVDEQECLDILDQIRVAVPEEIKTSRRVMQERDQILAEAHAEAERVVREAEEHVAGRVNEHALSRAAQSRAAEIEERALLAAEDIRREADTYAYRLLERLRQQVDQIGESVDRGLRELAPDDTQPEDAAARPSRRR